MTYLQRPTSLHRRPSTVTLAWIGLALGLGCSSLSAARPQIELNGTWDFYPDVGDSDLESLTVKPGTVQVPGAWQAQGYGQSGGTIPASLLQANTSPADHLRHNLTARCLYVRAVEVPTAWKGQRIFLAVRRVYTSADVTVNGQRIGEWEGFCSPFEFDVTDALKFGGRNQIVIGVDNRPHPGRDTYGTANWFGNWGGLGGRVYLEAREPCWVQDVFAIPRIADSEVQLRVTVKTARPNWPTGLGITAEVAPWDQDNRPTMVSGRAQHPVSAGGPGSEITFDLPLSVARLHLWTPDDPFLYVATVRLIKDGELLDEQQVRFGMRQITAQGNKLFLNGKPLYLSGYGDDATEPITGMLPADKGLYRHRLALMRNLGFNFVRHHSTVPHDEYLDAADEVGMLVQPEAGMAYTKFWPGAHQLFEREWPHIIRAFRNHPCIWAWCMGNEIFLKDLPEREHNSRAVDLSEPRTNGPLQTVTGPDNGAYGSPGEFPTRSFKQCNYYRDVEVQVDGRPRTLLADADTSRVYRDGPHELGLRFICTSTGYVSKIRFLKVPEETGSHVGHLWEAGGRELARVAFIDETASGWQEATLDTAVCLKPNQVYLVSVNANTAYAATSSGGLSGFSRQDMLRVLETAYHQAKALDPTRLVHASDGGTLHEFTDVFSSGDAEQFGPKPYLLHEYGTYTCSLPDFSLIPRLNGVIRPLTYEHAQGYVREHGLEEVYPRLYRSSLQMRADAQKHYMEAAKASGANNGYSFWLGVDFPDSPEGCWDEGILNQLWEPKPGLTNDLTDFTGSTVLLTTVALGERSFYCDQTKRVGLRLWHYGAKPIEKARLTWRLQEGKETLQRGEIAGVACAPGQTVSLGEAVVGGFSGERPRFVTLRTELRRGQTPLAQNAWEFYAYPHAAHSEPLAGVYSEAGPLPGARELQPGERVPENARLLITRALKRERHAVLLGRGNAAVLLLGTGGFKETRAGYFLNQSGGAFGGIIEHHPVFAPIPHDGRLHLGLYQLVAGGGVLNADAMPAALREGSVVWGLRLTAWVSPVKDMQRVTAFSDVVTDHHFHLILSSLDLLANKPECRYVLARTMEYLLSGQSSPLTRRCTEGDLEKLLN